MTIWPVLLVMEDIFVLIAMVLFLLIRQRATLIIGIIIAAVLLLCNVLVISGYRNWFVLALPFATLWIIILIGRPFLKRPIFTVGPKAVIALLVIVGVVLLASLVLLVLLRPA